MNTLWHENFETWDNTPKNIRELIHRDTTIQDIQSEMELLLKK